MQIVIVVFFYLQGYNSRGRIRTWVWVVALAATLARVRGACPWPPVPELQDACVCAFNLARDMSVQCDQVISFPNSQ